MVARAAHGHGGIYIAYNRDSARDAKARCPALVKCFTAHNLAFGAVGRRYAHRLGGPRVPGAAAPQILEAEALKLTDGWLLPATGDTDRAGHDLALLPLG